MLDLLPFVWTPLEQLDARKPAERDLFKLWISQGHMIGIPGPVVRFDFVAAQIAQLAARYDIKAIGYDPWRIDEFKQELDDIGCSVKLEPVGQGFRTMGGAIPNFIERALLGQLRHGGHPVLKASVASSILVSDAAGNLKIDKDKSLTAASIRTDACVAAVMATHLAGTRKPAKQIAFEEDFDHVGAPLAASTVGYW